MFITSLDLIWIAALLVFAEMTLLWAIQLRTHNAAVVDVGWAGGVALIAVLHALLGGGYGPRRLLAVTMALLWGVRLALYLYATRVRGHVEEDGRYQQLRKDWQPFLQLKFFAFFQAQAVLALIFALPLWLMSRNDVPELRWSEWVGACLWAVGVVGESVADIQLKGFKGRPESRGQVCQEGLWGYSRHPNYFFEWVSWVGFAVAALASPWGWLALICPALMLVFLFRLTGIPATEAQALRSKGDRYREYQRTTSAFLPWRRKA